MIYGNPLDLTSYAMWNMRRDFLLGSMKSMTDTMFAALDERYWRAT
jgi:hypothetical protein